jgi:hypothetical protein
MFVTSLLIWWYSAGWRDQMSLFSERLARAVDYYSIVSLLKSLFAPFRQISAGSPVSGSLDVKMRAWLDRLVSRFIGAMIRTVIIIIGIFALLFECIFGVVRLVVWPVLPILPLVGMVIAMSGWIPW